MHQSSAEGRQTGALSATYSQGEREIQGGKDSELRWDTTAGHSQGDRKRQRRGGQSA
jgi:hypothetical protein